MAQFLAQGADGSRVEVFRGFSKLALVTVVVTLLFTPSQAQLKRIDAEHSTASLTLVSADSGKSINVGIAKVSGAARLDSDNPAANDLDLYIYPARQGPRLLNPDGSFRTNGTADLSRYTLMTFHSNHAEIGPDGRVAITGDLTITHFEREANVEWNNAYAGPEYHRLMRQSVIHEATFVVENPSSSGRNQEEIAARATITAQDFPALRGALMNAVWPIVVEDEQCEMPDRAPSMRDYAGATCTGKPVLVTPPTQAAQYYFGRDYPGVVSSSSPPRDGARIVLQIRLSR